MWCFASRRRELGYFDFSLSQPGRHNGELFHAGLVPSAVDNQILPFDEAVAAQLIKNIALRLGPAGTE